MKARTPIHFVSLAAGLLAALLLGAASVGAAPPAQADDASPPAETIKLIFVHHSTGENWLRDDDGGLGRALGENNYFVSDTNYGWGPDAIGDRTDIVNWPEWFRGPESGRYLEALYGESGQHSEYTRALADPGGENQVVMFKSCFPNSNLEGSPADPPAPGEGLTVGYAKFVYNDLLNYFVTRPDKLFVVVTAPPVSDPEYAANARAFNTWLMQDWLRDNDYPYANVAVFDFYNVLTGPDNHHRFEAGGVEYVNDQGGDTTYYPSEDDHPSQEGNRKATAEFVPLLNVFYHRWRAGAPAAPTPQGEAAQPTAALPTPPALAEAPAAVVGLIDDFERGAPAGTAGWEAFWDEATDTSIACGPAADAPHSGASALRADFDVAADSWATCALLYGGAQNWAGGQGVTFFARTSEPGLTFDVMVYAGGEAERETYLATLDAAAASPGGWAAVEMPWAEFRRVDWEADAGLPFAQPAAVTGLAFGFGAPGGRHRGTAWIDDVGLLTETPPAAEPPGEAPAATQAAAPAPAGGERSVPCLGGALPLALAALVGWRRRASLPKP